MDQTEMNSQFQTDPHPNLPPALIFFHISQISVGNWVEARPVAARSGTVFFAVFV